MSAGVSQADSALLGVLRPFASGDFDLCLVVDDAPSMEMWRDNLAQFASVTRRASFRSVSVHRLDTSAPGSLLCVDHDGGTSPASDLLGEPAPGRVLLLATDGLGAAWRDGRMSQLLGACATHTPLGVMQVLPQRLWYRTGNPVVEVEWRADGPGTPAADLRRRPPGPTAGPKPPVDDAVPLIALDLAALGTWARLTAVGGGVWHQGLGLRLIRPLSPVHPTPPADGQHLVRLFQRTAERDSVRLAALLAVAPVITVTLLRGMHRRLLPDRGDYPVAEAFLSGLLSPAPAATGMTEPAYVFQPEVAEALRATLPPADVQRAMSVAEEFLPPGAWDGARVWPQASHGQRAQPGQRDRGAELKASHNHLPSRNGHFTGRAALLRELRGKLTAGTGPCVLYGTGGVGKSRTALEYAYLHQGDYDFVWWLEATDAVKLTQSLEALGTALGIEPGPSGAPPVQAVLDRLRRGRVRKGWLLVLDNAETVDKMGQLLPDGDGHVIVTSRTFSWTRQVSDVVPVTPFERAESLSVLRRLVPTLPEADADDLAERTGDLPLAVLEIGRFLSEVGPNVAAYLAEFDELCTMLLQEGGLLGYPVPLVASWRATLDVLEKDMPSAVQLFHLLCHLGVGPVSQDLLFAAVGRGMPPGPGAVLCRPVPLQQALRRLCDAGLATLDRAIHTVEVHRVLQLVARQRFMEPNQRQEADEAVLCLLAAAMPASLSAPGAPQLVTEIVRRLNLAPAVASERPEVNDLVLVAVRHHKNRGDLQAARMAAELAESVWRNGPRARTDRLKAVSHCMESSSHPA
ncbi:hypothetical protein RKD23_007609 [Streptomyces sp. SAI-170]|uniref:FxSxx-COOH system tetratricopeptide repeat protein n=1 Tax=Streptomyces sp. SAI-170 TaxID=3377729 RepID=UPI003C7CB6F1